MTEKTFDILLPIPAKVTANGEKFPIRQLTTFAVAEKFSAVAGELENLFRTIGLKVTAAADQADLTLGSADLAPGAWQMSIGNDRICAAAGDIAGAWSAISAFAQMLFAATITGAPDAALDGVAIEDQPRFTYRGFHLDCARHFQSKAMVKKFLRVLALCRINTFHWHLVDSQGWRYPTQAANGMGPDGELSIGQYSRDDLQEITCYAKTLGITVIPEVDVPGHSAMLLANNPQYACDPAHPGEEFCIGNPETMKFLKRLFAELMEIFPDSPVIHLGGDEAASANWENCPVCRDAMHRRGLTDMRQLENSFMVELSRFIVESGRTPMIWGTCSGQVYPADTVIQSWLDIREPLKVAPHGNKIVYSVHSSLYFDYPASLSEPWESWMFELSEKGVYMTDPYIIWPEKVQDAIIGTEACLWTETIPQQRIFAKLFPRILAYSECAWSRPEKKSYADFRRRRETLEAAGFVDYLKGL